MNREQRRKAARLGNCTRTNTSIEIVAMHPTERHSVMTTHSPKEAFDILVNVKPSDAGAWWTEKIANGIAQLVAGTARAVLIGNRGLELRPMPDGLIGILTPNGAAGLTGPES